MNHQGPQIPEDVNDSNLYRAYRLLLSVCETGVLSRACDRTGLSLPTASVFSTCEDVVRRSALRALRRPHVFDRAHEGAASEADRGHACDRRTLQRGERVRPRRAPRAS